LPAQQEYCVMLIDLLEGVERFAPSDRISTGSCRLFEFLVQLLGMQHHTSKIEAADDTMSSGRLDQLCSGRVAAGSTWPISCILSGIMGA